MFDQQSLIIVGIILMTLKAVVRCSRAPWYLTNNIYALNHHEKESTQPAGASVLIDFAGGDVKRLKIAVLSAHDFLSHMSHFLTGQIAPLTC